MKKLISVMLLSIVLVLSMYSSYQQDHEVITIIY